MRHFLEEHNKLRQIFHYHFKRQRNQVQKNSTIFDKLNKSLNAKGPLAHKRCPPREKKTLESRDGLELALIELLFTSEWCYELQDKEVIYKKCGARAKVEFCLSKSVAFKICCCRLHQCQLNHYSSFYKMGVVEVIRELFSLVCID